MNKPPKKTKLPQPVYDAAIVMMLEAIKRRDVLQKHGCGTYLLRYGSVHVESILCFCCGFETRNQEDIDKRYCRLCRTFHSESRQETLSKSKVSFLQTPRHNTDRPNP